MYRTEGSDRTDIGFISSLTYGTQRLLPAPPSRLSGVGGRRISGLRHAPCVRGCDSRSDCGANKSGISRARPRLEAMSRVRKVSGRSAQINEEKEEKDSEDRSQRLHQAEAEGLAIKLSQHPQRLSDSENEEPVPDRIPHRSAFVSKSSANSLTSLAWGRQSKVERSQSCTDTTVNESITLGRRRAAHPPKAKVPLGGCLSSAVVGVLLSTENSRSFSAPVLTAEKRLSLNPLTSFVPLHKPDRSISPESNDSISEELNHFKPIVCSPCTPPKRLPDGRILSPVIIKSTPRNLRKSLQKPTTYEASPMILKKWEQVFQDRQMKKTLSKGTLTSSAEPDEDASSKNKQVPSSRELSACKNSRSGKRNTLLGDVELLPSSSKSVHLEMRDEGKNLVLSNNDSLVSTGPLTETGGATDFTDLNSNLRRGSKPIEADSKEPHSKCLRVKSLKTAIKRPHRISTQLVNMQNGACFRAAENISPQIPQRRGQKKRCKTKHLEQNGSFKRLKVTRGGKCVQGLDLRRKDTEQRLAQEEEDKKLALKLQQIFDKETRTVNRCKGSRDEYPLRSKSTAGAN